MRKRKHIQDRVDPIERLIDWQRRSIWRAHQLESTRKQVKTADTGRAFNSVEDMFVQALDRKYHAQTRMDILLLRHRRRLHLHLNPHRMGKHNRRTSRNRNSGPAEMPERRKSNSGRRSKSNRHPQKRSELRSSKGCIQKALQKRVPRKKHNTSRRIPRPQHSDADRSNRLQTPKPDRPILTTLKPETAPKWPFDRPT